MWSLIWCEILNHLKFAFYVVLSSIQSSNFNGDEDETKQSTSGDIVLVIIIPWGRKFDLSQVHLSSSVNFTSPKIKVLKYDKRENIKYNYLPRTDLSSFSLWWSPTDSNGQWACSKIWGKWFYSQNFTLDHIINQLWRYWWKCLILFCCFCCWCYLHSLKMLSSQSPIWESSLKMTGAR